MNKKLYIRLFKHKDGIPFDSLEIAGWNLLSTKEMDHYIKKDGYIQTMTDWLCNNPEGKVDFVLL